MKFKIWNSKSMGICHGLALLLGAMAWSGLAMTAHSEQLLKNTDFDNELDYWKVYVQKGTFKKDTSEHELRLVVPCGDSISSSQLFQAVPLEDGKSYRLSFEAMREGDDVPISVAYMQGGPPFASYGLVKAVQVNKDWSAHEFVFTVTPVLADNPGVVRLMFGNQTGAIHFRKFSLTPAEDPPLHP